MALVRRLGTYAVASILLTAACGDGGQVTAGGTGSGSGTGSGAPGGSGSGAQGSGQQGGGFMLNPAAPAPMAGAGSAPSSPAAVEPTAEANCGIQTKAPEKLPPELLLVLDRSGSMRETGPNGQPKWGETTTAVGNVVMMTQGTVNWGLKFFPVDFGCGPALVPLVQPKANAHADIMQGIMRSPPNGGTPTTAAITNALTWLKASTTPNPKFIVLATDGLPTCRVAQPGGRPDGTMNGSDAQNAIAAVGMAATAGIPVFVIGVGTGDVERGTLNQMAMAGGRPRGGAAEQYYPTGSAAELTAALGTISSRIASCTFTLMPAPKENQPIAVNLQGTRLAKDTDWVFGAGRGSIELVGAACETVQKDEKSAVEILYGCPGQVIP
jgi:hypothetical protein